MVRALVDGGQIEIGGEFSTELEQPGCPAACTGNLDGPVLAADDVPAAVIRRRTPSVRTGEAARSLSRRWLPVSEARPWVASPERGTGRAEAQTLW